MPYVRLDLCSQALTRERHMCNAVCARETSTEVYRVLHEKLCNHHPVQIVRVECDEFRHALAAYAQTSVSSP